MNYITLQSHIDMLVARYGSRSAVSKVLGIDAGNLSAMYNGKKPLTSANPLTLKRLGLQHHSFYSIVKDARRTKTQ